MELQLKNIGMIKEANVKIDGLTVLAGENDTGKSTVGKALFFIKEFQEIFLNPIDYKNMISKKNEYEKRLKDLQDKLENINDNNIDNIDEFEFENLADISSVFTSMSSMTSKISHITKEMEGHIKILEFIEKIKDASDDELKKLSMKVNLNNISSKFKDFFYFELENNIHFVLEESNNKIGLIENVIVQENDNLSKKPIIFIETPILSNLFSFFSKLDTIQTEIKYKINDYPYTLRSLYKQLKLPLEDESNIDKSNILKNIVNFINGHVSVGNGGDLIFKREGKEHNILSVATGIKTFGIFQMLLENNYLDKNSILILDEPEVHLHPKWQLEMAKIIVELVKNGVKVLVTSHSPYMVEALKRYSEVEKIEDKTNFYLPEDEYIKKVNDSNLETLENRLSNTRITH